MTAKITWRGKEFEIETAVCVKDALAQLHLDTEAHLVMRDGQLLQEADVLEDGDQVKLIPVMIGG